MNELLLVQECTKYIKMAVTTLNIYKYIQVEKL